MIFGWSTLARNFDSRTKSAAAWWKLFGLEKSSSFKCLITYLLCPEGSSTVSRRCILALLSPQSSSDFRAMLHTWLTSEKPPCAKGLLATTSLRLRYAICFASQDSLLCRYLQVAVNFSTSASTYAAVRRATLRCHHALDLFCRATFPLHMV